MSKKIKCISIYQVDKSRFGSVGDEQGQFLLSEEFFDETGHAVKQVFYNADGIEEERILRNFDQQGRRTEEVVQHLLTETFDKRVIVYDDVQRTSEEVQYYGTDPGERTLTRFHESGDILEIKHYDADGEFESRQVFGYNEKNQAILDEEYNSENELLQRTVTAYDEAGKMARQDISFPNKADDYHTVGFSYGHLSSEEVATGVDGSVLYTMNITYNGQGLETEEIRHNALDPTDSWRIVSEYDGRKPTLREHYSDSGILLYRLQFTHANGLVTEEGRFLTAAYVGEVRNTIKRFSYAFWD